MDPTRALVAINTGSTLSVIPDTEEAPDMYLKRIIFAEYLATPESDVSSTGINKLAIALDVPVSTLNRWKSNRSFQALVAKRAREYATDGLGLALAYQEMLRIIADKDTPAHVRARVCSDLVKLDIKRTEMFLGFKAKAEANKRDSSKKSFEDEVEEASYVVIDDE